MLAAEEEAAAQNKVEKRKEQNRRSSATHRERQKLLQQPLSTGEVTRMKLKLAENRSSDHQFLQARLIHDDNFNLGLMEQQLRSDNAVNEVLGLPTKSEEEIERCISTHRNPRTDTPIKLPPPRDFSNEYEGTLDSIPELVEASTTTGKSFALIVLSIVTEIPNRLCFVSC